MKIPSIFGKFRAVSDPQAQKFVVVCCSSLPKHKLRIEYELSSIGKVSTKIFGAEA
ncbi:hypothetical protein [Tychonema sp. LEGE 06208]|uniref:hypothetical protein n=1 Tax=Tychonema sp. LEGE 06208 TaxID=1828663 RepID=UPI001D1596FE|nr:hypothetical protein [Tychonema sp. LEGE 06208]